MIKKISKSKALQVVQLSKLVRTGRLRAGVRVVRGRENIKVSTTLKFHLLREMDNWEFDWETNLINFWKFKIQF